MGVQHTNIKIVQDMLDAWGKQDETGFCNPHAEDFTFNFCPNDIPALEAFTGNCIVGREGLRKWNRRTWGPAKPLLPLTKPAWTDWASVGDKVYANGKLSTSYFGTDAEEIHFYFCWTVENGQITYAAINGDFTKVAPKIEALEKENERVVRDLIMNWGQGKKEELLAGHADDVTWSYLPNQIKGVEEFSGRQSGKAKLKKFFDEAFAPGAAFEVCSVPIVDAMRAVGDKVYATFSYDLKTNGKGPIEFKAYYEWTLAKGIITNAVILADMSDFAALH